MYQRTTTAVASSSQPATLFEAAADLLRTNIAEKKLPEGIVLQESALAELLSMSRATVGRALSVLAEEGLVRKSAGRGFVVTGRDETPRRVDLRTLDLNLHSLDDMLGKPNWLRIQDRIEAELSRCLIFGRYRVVEALVAREFGVSRTVVRDVLGRLQERGLVQKNSSSRWVVEPLTARHIKEKFELRMVLEVAALKSADANLDALQRLAVDIRALAAKAEVSPETWFRHDDRFLELAILSTPNLSLAQFVSANRSALKASQRVLFSIGLPPDTQSLLELCVVIDLLRTGTVSAAADMLNSHLGNALKRTIAQLKIVSVIEPPQDLAPYLVPD